MLNTAGLRGRGRAPVQVKRGESFWFLGKAASWVVGMGIKLGTVNIRCVEVKPHMPLAPISALRFER